MNYVNRW